MLHDVAIDKGEIEVGYFIDPARKNRGFATAALSAAIEKLFASGFSVISSSITYANSGGSAFRTLDLVYFDATILQISIRR